MANLIITVIAIALVAIASLMGAYYGGSAFIQNEQAANASVVIGQATQVAASWNAYLGDNLFVPPTSLDLLLTGNYVTQGGYLASIPVAPPQAGGIASFPSFVASAMATINGVNSLHYFDYVDLGKPSTAIAATSVNNANATACVKIQKAASGVNPTVLTQAAQGSIFALGTTGLYGCGILTGTITGGLGGATVPAGDLNTGDYVMEYLLQ